MAYGKKITGYRKGLWAERYAALFLFLKGYRVIARRYKTSFGEIDLIARRKKTVIFTEVKFRKTNASALEAIDFKGKKRISKAAQHFMHHHLQNYSNQNDLTLRFDVVTVTPYLRIRHIQNAFEFCA